MVTPGSEGPVALTVSGVDRAGNRSPERTYLFYVTLTAPRIVRPWKTIFGAPAEFVFQPKMANVVEYTYRYNSGQETTVPAAADGTAAVTLTVTRHTGNRLQVWSRTRDGHLSGTSDIYFTPEVSEPEVSHDGDVFTFKPEMYGVVRYEYSLDRGPRQQVQAGPDGIATVTIPHEPGRHALDGWSYNADGLASEPTWHTWSKD